jgi:hypothetical protein
MAIALVDNPAVVDPRKFLTPSQIDVLRDLERFGRATKARNGWHLGGVFRKATTIKPLTTHGLAREDFRDGRHVLVLTYAGITALARLTSPSLRQHDQRQD